MIDDEALNRLWREASRSVGEPQCTWPQTDTLRAFYNVVYTTGYQAGLNFT
jgi:hypothetical protein